MTATCPPIVTSERAFLLRLQRQALEYFLENQEPSGLMLDRQRNFEPLRTRGICSTATTGMGCIALALASAAPHRLLPPREAGMRIRAAVHAALERLPEDHGILPHFVDAGGAAFGCDVHSTVDSSWLFAGALWAAEFLQDAALEQLATRLYQRVDWNYWTDQHPLGLLRHGKGPDGRFLACPWDRLNGETVFMYVLAAGAEGERAISAAAGAALTPAYGSVAGHSFNNADLGLFVFQYGLDLLDLSRWQCPTLDLHHEAAIAARANRDFCRQESERFATYRRFWGISAGDGPGQAGADDVYRAYAPLGEVDGTAHLTATLASIAHCSGDVLENLLEAERDGSFAARGRYGFSNVNLDRQWVARDMVGIDAGAAALALDNFLMDGRVRRVFHRLPCVDRGLRRLGFTLGANEQRRAS